LVKSLTETHPFAGCANAPVDVQWYVDGREHVPPPPVAVGDGDVADRPVHFWLEPPLQVQISTAEPLAVPAPVTSRHSPDPTPTTVPSEFTRHCWLTPPLQVQISTRVPAAVLFPGTSRHLVP
jgi:hypothetical protein